MMALDGTRSRKTTGDTGYWNIDAAGQVTGFQDLGTDAAGYHTLPVASSG